jgi:predicted ATPase
MQFLRVHLENWRNFSTVDVAVQTRAFLIGANASGKSNFLDAFRFLRDLVMPGGGFQEAVIKRGGVSVIRNLAARHPNTNVLIEVDLGDEEEHEWRYSIMFNQDNRSRPVLREEKIWHNGELILNRPDDDDRADIARLSQTQLEQTFANRNFREITDFFGSVSYSHIVPQLVRDPERSIGRQADPFGGDFLEQIAAENKRTQEARLRRIQTALKIAIPQLSSLELFRDDKTGVAHLRGKYQHWRSQGAWQTEVEFSDGTLRLMGLLWSLQVGTGPLLLEEPELSLHPGVVRHLPQMIRRIQRQMKPPPRQLFISTHSRELLSDEGIAPDEVLLFLTSSEGTEIRAGADDDAIQHELDAGFRMGDIVLTRTEPPDLRQLSLFAE